MINSQPVSHHAPYHCVSNFRYCMYYNFHELILCRDLIIMSQFTSIAAVYTDLLVLCRMSWKYPISFSV